MEGSCNTFGRAITEGFDQDAVAVIVVYYHHVVIACGGGDNEAASLVGEDLAGCVDDSSVAKVCAFRYLSDVKWILHVVVVGGSVSSHTALVLAGLV